MPPGLMQPGPPGPPSFDNTPQLPPGPPSLATAPQMPPMQPGPPGPPSFDANPASALAGPPGLVRPGPPGPPEFPPGPMPIPFGGGGVGFGGGPTPFPEGPPERMPMGGGGGALAQLPQIGAAPQMKLGPAATLGRSVLQHRGMASRGFSKPRKPLGGPRRGY